MEGAHGIGMYCTVPEAVGDGIAMEGQVMTGDHSWSGMDQWLSHTHPGQSLTKARSSQP